MKPLLVSVIALTAFAAQAASQRYTPQRPVVVKLEFDGDANFPSLTNTDTSGLARFTGAAFGLSAAERDAVVDKIQDLIEEDYRSFNVKFVRATNLLSPPDFTWGIDDTSFICAASDGSCGKLYGKAGSLDGTFRFARTWAGSFALSGGTQPSQPPLRRGGALAGGTVTVDNIAQALANGAAHEIGHLFGLRHIGCNTTTIKQILLCNPSASEAVMATNDLTFNSDELILLGQAIGPDRPLFAFRLGVNEDSGTGLMWTQDANLPARVAGGIVGPTAGGVLGFAEAQAYTAALDFAGYDDWRLPSALDANGGGPCKSPQPFVLFPCSLATSELGRMSSSLLFDAQFVPAGATPSSFPPPIIDFASRRYWSTSTGDPWIFAFGSPPAQFDATTASPPVTAANAWAVRAPFTLVDNGDGTVVDTARRLMWIRNPATIVRAVRGVVDLRDDGRRTFAEAQSFVANLSVAGYTDWRLPRLDDAADYTCADPRVFTLDAPSSAGCAQNELAHLLRGWGVGAGDTAPIVMPSAPAPFWFGNTALGAQVLTPFTFSFSDGTLAAALAPATAYVLPVRDLEPGYLPRGGHVIADPDPRVVLRFFSVTAAGAVTFTPGPANIPGMINALLRSFVLSSTATFSGNVTVCLRFDAGDFTGDPTRLRVGQRSPSGTFVALPNVPGYPDPARRVACGVTQSLGEFRLVQP